MYIKSCRICDHSPLTEILNLGKMPAVNYFPLGSELRKDLKKYPLVFCLCKGCGLAQINYVVPPEKLFQNYHYLTSASNPLITHFREFAEECVRRHLIKEGEKILDIGANDGTLLLEFKKFGVKPLGIDPSRNAVESAKKVGVEVIPEFFSASTAHSISAKHGKFKVITSNNVFAHTHDVKDYLKGVKSLLRRDGIFIAEFAHLLEMIMKIQFDVIYHEHLSFYALPPLMRLFAMFDLEIFDAKKILTQGGSLRIYVRHKNPKRKPHSASLQAILQEEHENHITELSTLHRFAAEVHQFRDDLCALVSSIKKKGKKIVGFGAPAKGVILLNYCKIGKSEIAYIVDNTPLKQGRCFPGGHIPVYAERILETDPCDYILLLAWNFQDEILKKLEPLRAKGVKVIIPFPKLRVV